MIFGGIVILLLLAFPEVETPLWWQAIVMIILPMEISGEISVMRAFINHLRGNNQK